MPVNLISVAIAWLATHLVLFSLSGFLLAGLFVAGVIGTPGQVQGPAAGTNGGDEMLATPDNRGTVRAGPEQLQTTVNRPAPAAMPYRPESAAAATADPGEPARRQPRLIGGSLPIYDQSRFTSLKSGQVHGAGLESFRPQGDGSPPGPIAMTRDGLLQDARRAFWNGDFEAAESAYMGLISEYPADADAFGELGNLYQAMGKQEMALDAYYEAALRLQASGERARFTEMVELLRREGDERADRLTP